MTSNNSWLVVGHINSDDLTCGESCKDKRVVTKCDWKNRMLQEFAIYELNFLDRFGDDSIVPRVYRYKFYLNTPSQPAAMKLC